MEDWNFQTKKEAHKRLHDKIQSIGYKGWNQWYAYNFFIEEEYQKWYNQDNIGILIHSGTRNTQKVEDGNNLS